VSDRYNAIRAAKLKKQADVRDAEKRDREDRIRRAQVRVYCRSTRVKLWTRSRAHVLSSGPVALHTCQALDP